MGSGINSTFRQVGIATGVAGLGAVFQSQVNSKLARTAAARAEGARRNRRLERLARGRSAPPAARDPGESGPRRRRRLRQRLQRDHPDRRDPLLRRRGRRLRPGPLLLVRAADQRLAPRRARTPQIANVRAVRSAAGAAKPDWMLRELRIENLLLIERAELRLGAGLNAITGETGAGKTVLAHSLDLLMGGKAKSGIVRPGAEEAWVEGVFDLPAGLLDDPELAELAERLPSGADEVVLGRRVSAGGRTSAFVAGRAATAADLKALGGRLLAFFGQHEHRKLTISSAQMEVLDGFAGPDHLALRDEYREAHREVGRLAAELAELREREGSRERDLDLYRYELSEIEEVEPDPEERAALAADRERLRHAEGLGAAAAGRPRGPGRGGPRRRRRGGAPGRGRIATGGRERARPVARRDRRAGRGAERRGRRRRRRAARLRRGGRRRPGRAARGRGTAGGDRPARTQARRQRRVGARPRRALPGRDRPARGRRGTRGRGDRGAGRGRSAPRGKLGEKLSAGREKAAKPLEKRVAAELAQLAMDGARLEVVLDPHPESTAPRAARRSSSASPRTRGSSPRRSATPPPAASSRG